MHIDKALHYYNKSKNLDTFIRKAPVTIESSIDDWINLLSYIRTTRLSTSGFLGIKSLLSGAKDAQIKSTLWDFAREQFDITPHAFNVRDTIHALTPTSVEWSKGTAEVLIRLPSLYRDYVTWTNINHEEAILFFAQHDLHRLVLWHRKGLVDITPHLSACIRLCHKDICERKENHPLVSLVREPLPYEVAQLFSDVFIRDTYFALSGHNEWSREIAMYPPDTTRTDMDIEERLFSLMPTRYSKENLPYFIMMFNRELHWMRQPFCRDMNEYIIRKDLLVKYQHLGWINNDLVISTLHYMSAGLVAEFLMMHTEYLDAPEFQPYKDTLFLLQHYPDMPFYRMKNQLLQPTTSHEEVNIHM